MGAMAGHTDALRRSWSQMKDDEGQSPMAGQRTTMLYDHNGWLRLGEGPASWSQPPAVEMLKPTTWKPKPFWQRRSDGGEIR